MKLENRVYEREYIYYLDNKVIELNYYIYGDTPFLSIRNMYIKCLFDIISDREALGSDSLNLYIKKYILTIKKD